MRFFRSILYTGFLIVFLLVEVRGVLALSQRYPSLSSKVKEERQFTLAELGYAEEILTSPSGVTKYILSLPEGWKLYAGSFFELDISYMYDYLGVSDQSVLPSFLGDVIVQVDGQTLTTFPIRRAKLDHLRLRVDFPPSLFNDVGYTRYTIEITLQADHICEIPHRARLIIHPTSFFSLSYERLSATIDLARYPRPFNNQQWALEPDLIRFVLPSRPTKTTLDGSIAIVSKLGDLTSGVIISQTTDLELLNDLNKLKADELLGEHLVVIGRPEDNKIILELNDMGALPLLLRERQLSLSSQGRATVSPGDNLTYTLTLTNNVDGTFTDLTLVDKLPPYVQMKSCSSSCSISSEGEIRWPLPTLAKGVVLSRTLVLSLSETISETVIENTITLLSEESGSLNVNTLTTTVSSTSQPDFDSRFSNTFDEGYFFTKDDLAVSENDGIIQELASPWDQTRAILVISGSSEQAVYKASRAMSLESHFPGMQGTHALVRDIRSRSKYTPPLPKADLTFADLGYSDRELRGFSSEISYYFELPFSWHLKDGTFLDLQFRHSQLMDYSQSYLSILFNGKPVTTVMLSDESSLKGHLRIELPSAQARPGQNNRISIQVNMRPLVECANLDLWLLMNSASRLHFDYEIRDDTYLDLGLYPYPFDQSSDRTNTLFVIPPDFTSDELKWTLKLAYALGSYIDKPGQISAVTMEDFRSEAAFMNSNFIVIGRPTRNPMIKKINSLLPQPFLPDSDIIEHQLDRVILRLSPDADLGYIQLISSPWNETRVLLAVTGTTDEGLRHAVRTLIFKPWTLRGNLALIRGDEINALDTRELTDGGKAMALATSVPEMTPAVTATATVVFPTPVSTPANLNTEQISPETDRPAWLMPLIVATGLVIGVIFFIAFRQSKRGGL